VRQWTGSTNFSAATFSRLVVTGKALADCESHAGIRLPPLYTSTGLMLIKRLHANNLLTFRDFDLEFKPGHQTIVGPNGAGKSNVVRLFDLIGTAIQASTANHLTQPGTQTGALLRAFAASHLDDNVAEPARAELQLVFDVQEERDLLTTFLRAAVLCTLSNDLQSSGIKTDELTEWATQSITADSLTELFAGTFVLNHVGLPHVVWEVRYDFTCSGKRVSWVLDAPGSFEKLVPTEVIESHIGQHPQRDLAQVLLSISRNTPSPIELPQPIHPFSLSSICPQGDQILNPPAIRPGDGNFDNQNPVFREAIEMLGLPTREQSGNQSFQIAGVLSRIWFETVGVFGEYLRGAPQGPTASALATAANLVGGSYSPALLPIRLFQMKNGDRDQRLRFETVRRTFAKLAHGQSLDVQFQPMAQLDESVQPVIPGTASIGGISSDEPETGPVGIVQVTVPTARGRDLPIHLHGAGTWEALLLAEALSDTRGKVVILDEPATTLHPSWQHHLNSCIRSGEGQTLVITHSSDLLPLGSADDVARLIRVDQLDGVTCLHRLTLLRAATISRITREFGTSAEARSLLFARCVVLLEGEMELGALPAWFQKCAPGKKVPSPDQLDMSFISVGGDGGFGTYATVLEGLGIPWVIVCDGAAFDIGTRSTKNRHILRQVLDAGIDDEGLREFIASSSKRGAKMTDLIWDKAIELGRACGIFTLAKDWRTTPPSPDLPGPESFEAFLDQAMPGVRLRAKEKVEDSKARQGIWLGEQQRCPDEVADLYSSILAALARRGSVVYGATLPDTDAPDHGGQSATGSSVL
jgi:predicted ATPase